MMPQTELNKLFAFDSSGNINIATTIGSNTGNWATATAYAERDIVKDTSTNNIFQCKTAHTSSGSQPLTTNTDSAKWDLLVDAESATTSATNAQTSAVNSANSATASANSATASQASAVNSATSEANASTSENNASASAQASANSATASANSATSSATTLTNFEKQYLGSKSSAPTADNDGNTLDATYEGTLYFNSSNDELYVWNGSAWEQASFSAGGFMSQNNNLSDVANVATSRTNLGLGTASTLNVGTSANNVVQLDGNAKLPAVSGENLTGLSAGTDAIDMVVGTGSDAISVGDVITRESNGETKKVKKTSTTTNYSVGAIDHLETNIGNAGWHTSTYNPHGHTQVFEVCGSHDGRFVVFWGSAWPSYSYYAIAWVHNGSGSWTIGSSRTSVNDSHNGGQVAVPTLRFSKSLNTSAGGTWLAFYQDNGRYTRTIFFTVDSGTGHQVWKYGESGSTSSFYSKGRDASGSGTSVNEGNTIRQVSSERVDILSLGNTYNKTYVGSWKVEYNGSQYTCSTIGGVQTNDQNYSNSGYGSSYYSRFALCGYDHKNDRLIGCVVDSQRKLTFVKAKPSGNNVDWTFEWASNAWSASNLADNGVIDQGYEYGDYVMQDGYGQAFLSSRNYRAGHGAIRYHLMAVDGAMTSYNASGVNNFIYTSRSSDYNYIGGPPMKWDILNRKLLVWGTGYNHSDSLQSWNNLQNSMRVISMTESGGYHVTFNTDSTVSTGSYDGTSGSEYLRFRMWGLVDGVSITSLTDAKAGRYLMFKSNNATGTGTIKWASGTIPHSVTTSTTNKSDAFGIAQKAGTAGDTISVLPFDSESIDQNQTSLTHGTKYYVTSTGALSTATTPDADIANDPDNPLVGQAINSTYLRLPSKSISGGGTASSDTSKIFCGAVDLKNDSGVQTSFTLSKPADINASDIRSYVIEYYGIMTSTTNDYYVLQMKPYNGGSTVMSGTFYGTGFTYYYGSHGNFNTNFSTYLNIAYLGGESYKGTASANRASTNINYTPSWSGQAVYENNINHASLSYYCSARVGTNNNYMKHEWWTGGAVNSANVTNYADSFYFEPRTGTWTEGVVSLYAITK
tara:strand:+ start:44 stop:3292 length:3249 start_codon:yes stop_codon:yes gene_type:complete